MTEKITFELVQRKRADWEVTHRRRASRVTLHPSDMSAICADVLALFKPSATISQQFQLGYVGNTGDDAAPLKWFQSSSVPRGFCDFSCDDEGLA